MDPTLRTLSPVFDSVIVCAVLVVPTNSAPNATAEGFVEATGATPIPESATVDGLPVALWLIVRLPEALPRWLG